MIGVLGGILGGVGLLFFGMWLLSENLKTLVGPRLRMLASRLADNRFAAFGWGTLAGAITQSSPAVTFITISMLRSGLISARQGYPIALGAQMGVGLILFIVTVDIRIAALFGIGIGGIIVTRLQRGNYREAGAMLFGVASLLFGLVLIKESAQPLSEQNWFQAGLELSAGSILLSFVLGALLTFIVQALVPVVAFGIGLAAAELVGVEQVLMYIYGSYVGLAISVMVVSSGLSGTARQLGMFWSVQVLFSAAILVILLYIEVYAQVPLVKSVGHVAGNRLGPADGAGRDRVRDAFPLRSAVRARLDHAIVRPHLAGQRCGGKLPSSVYSRPGHGRHHDGPGPGPPGTEKSGEPVLPIFGTGPHGAAPGGGQASHAGAQRTHR